MAEAETFIWLDYEYHGYYKDAEFNFFFTLTSFDIEQIKRNRIIARRFTAAVIQQADGLSTPLALWITTLTAFARNDVILFFGLFFLFLRFQNKDFVLGVWIAMRLRARNDIAMFFLLLVFYRLCRCNNVFLFCGYLGA